MFSYLNLLSFFLLFKFILESSPECMGWFSYFMKKALTKKGIKDGFFQKQSLAEWDTNPLFGCFLYCSFFCSSPPSLKVAHSQILGSWRRNSQEQSAHPTWASRAESTVLSESIWIWRGMKCWSGNLIQIWHVLVKYKVWKMLMLIWNADDDLLALHWQPDLTSLQSKFK